VLLAEYSNPALVPRQKSTHVDNPREVGRRLREARLRAGLSQRDLSFPGCSPAYISRIEAGDRIPSLQLLREMGQRLGVSEDYLATGARSALLSDRNPLLIEAEVALRLDDYEIAGDLYGTALEEARDNFTRADAMEGLGHVAYRRGQPKEAIRLLRRSLELSRTEPAERPGTTEILARSHAALGDVDIAVALLTQCLERFRKENDPVNRVRFAVLLGYALTDAGQFNEAERILAEGLEAARGVKDAVTRARLLWSQARLNAEQGNSEAGAQYARKALEVLRTTEHSHFIALTHQLLAHLYNDLGRGGDALEVLEEGWPMLLATATPTQIAHYRVEEARARAALGEREEAAGVAMEALGPLAEAQPQDAGRAYALLGDIFADLGDTARANELLELAIEILEAQPPSRYLVAAYKRKAALLRQEGQIDEAIALLERGLTT
jgi:tetratricopeptide (TPR) repeat protein